MQFVSLAAVFFSSPSRSFVLVLYSCVLLAENIAGFRSTKKKSLVFHVFHMTSLHEEEVFLFMHHVNI